MSTSPANKPQVEMDSPSSSSVYLRKDLYEEGSIDPVYQAKAHVLNRALQEIGMGRYQVSTGNDFYHGIVLQPLAYHANACSSGIFLQWLALAGLRESTLEVQ
jgi:hypothetical protein